MALFGSKTKVGLELADPGPFEPGQAIEARITLGEIDKKARGGRIELLYVNDFATIGEVDWEGELISVLDETRPGETRESEEVVIDQQPLELRAGTHTVRLTLPADAPPSAADAVEWSVRAVVDRERGGDSESDEQIVVRDPTGKPDWAQGPATTEGDEVAVEFEGIERTVRPGGLIEGTVAITARERVEAAYLQVELAEREEGRRGAGFRSKIASEFVVDESFVIEAGESRRVPLRIALPDDARPVFEAKNNSLHCVLEVRLEKAIGRAVGAFELNVISA